MLHDTEKEAMRDHNNARDEAGPRGNLLRNPMLLAVSLTAFASFTGLGMVNTVRVLYAQSHGASLAIISAMASAYLVANFVFQYPAGWVADYWGRRQVMIIGLAAQALLTFLYLFVNDPLVFVALRFLEGIAAAGIIPAARALITDSIPPRQQGEAFGIFSAFFNAGFLLGPGLGGLLATTGFASAFIGAILFRLVAIVLLLTMVRAAGQRVQLSAGEIQQTLVKPVSGALQAVLTSQRTKQRFRLSSLSQTLLTLPLLGAYLIVFADFLYIGFDQTLLPIWLHDHLHADIALIGLVYVAWSLPNILLSPLGGRMADRRQRSLLVLVFGLAQVPIYISYGLANTIVLVLVLSVLHGVVYAFVQPALDAQVASSSAANARAQVQGFYTAIGFVGAFVGAGGFSWLYAINFRLPLFTMGAVFGIFVIIGSALIYRSEKKKRESETPRIVNNTA